LWQAQALYAVNIYLGRKKNDQVALAWAAQFCDDGAVLDRNFSLLGTGNNSGEVSANRITMVQYPCWRRRTACFEV
jgi:hypothetical protein